LALDRVPPGDELEIEFRVTETMERHKIPGGAEQESEVFDLQPLPVEVDRLPKSRMDWDGIWDTLPNDRRARSTKNEETGYAEELRCVGKWM